MSGINGCSNQRGTYIRYSSTVESLVHPLSYTRTPSLSPYHVFETVSKPRAATTNLTNQVLTRLGFQHILNSHLVRKGAPSLPGKPSRQPFKSLTLSINPCRSNITLFYNSVVFTTKLHAMTLIEGKDARLDRWRWVVGHKMAQVSGVKFGRNLGAWHLPCIQ